ISQRARRQIYRYGMAPARGWTIFTNGEAKSIAASGLGSRSMSRFSSFLLGAICGALVSYAAMNFHVIRARDGFHFVNEQPPRMAETYVDVRGFGMPDWAGRPQLTSALVGANQQRLLGEGTSDAIESGVKGLLPSWSPNSPTQ